VSDVQSAITIEVNKGGALKSRMFQGGVDYTAGMGGAAETITAPVVFVGYGLSEPSLKWDELKASTSRARSSSS